MEKLEKLFQWIAMMVIGALAAIAALFAKDRWFPSKEKHQPSFEELLDIIKHNESAMKLKLDELEKLRSDISTHQNLINELKGQVEEHRSALKQAYADSGRSANEIADALRKVKKLP